MDQNNPYENFYNNTYVTAINLVVGKDIKTPVKFAMSAWFFSETENYDDFNNEMSAITETDEFRNHITELVVLFTGTKTADKHPKDVIKKLAEISSYIDLATKTKSSTRFMLSPPIGYYSNLKPFPQNIYRENGDDNCLFSRTFIYQDKETSSCSDWSGITAIVIDAKNPLEMEAYGRAFSKDGLLLRDAIYEELTAKGKLPGVLDSKRVSNLLSKMCSPARNAFLLIPSMTFPLLISTNPNLVSEGAVDSAINKMILPTPIHPKM